MITQGFDEWFKARHTKTGIYKDALSGGGDATYIRHEMRKAYLKGAASRQAEIDALRGEVAAVLRECLNMNHQDIISALRHVLNSSGTTENSEP